MPKVKLTETAIARAATPESEYILYWDTEMKGLVLRVNASGSKALYFTYTTADGKRRRQKLGNWPALKLAAAERCRR